jgi:hypothetical protein
VPDDFDWHLLANGGATRPMLVGRLDALLCRVLGCPDSRVFISPSYAPKLRFRHSLGEHHLQMMPVCLEYGMVMREPDRSKCLTFVFEDNRHHQKAFEMVVKTTGENNELWVRTYHIVRAKDLRRRIKKASIIRPQIR